MLCSIEKAARRRLAEGVVRGSTLYPFPAWMQEREGRMDVQQQLELLSGSLVKVLAEALGEAFKELRIAAPERAEQLIEAIEKRAIIKIENTPFETIPDEIQLHVVEHARKMLAVMFSEARRTGV